MAKDKVCSASTQPREHDELAQRECSTQTDIQSVYCNLLGS